MLKNDSRNVLVQIDLFMQHLGLCHFYFLFLILPLTLEVATPPDHSFSCSILCEAPLYIILDVGEKLG